MRKTWTQENRSEMKERETKPNRKAADGGGVQTEDEKETCAKKRRKEISKLWRRASFIIEESTNAVHDGLHLLKQLLLIKEHLALWPRASHARYCVMTT